jgi:uncharacterized phiE125 gp8 family phage protein
MTGTVLETPTATALGGAEEWLTLDEVRAQCRIDDGTEDELLVRLIDTAAAYIANYGVAVAPKSVSFGFDGFSDAMTFPVSPVRSITSVTYADQAGASVVLSPSAYRLVQRHKVWRLARSFNEAWPDAARGEQVMVVAEVGFAERREVSEDIRHAALLLIGHYNKHREGAASGQAVADIPMGVDHLLSAHRLRWVA